MPYAVVHLPEFPIAAWLRSSPELRGMPLAVLIGVAPQETVASLNAIASAKGAARGMSKVQAEAACSPRFRARDIEEERAAFTAAIEIAARFSPRLESLCSPQNEYAGNAQLAGALALDCSGTEALFGDPHRYGVMLQADFVAAGFLCGVAIAPCVEAALMLARSSTGVVSATEESLATQLQHLPVSLLPCQPSMVAILHRWGVRTLGQLARLPETALVSRLGQNGLRMQRLARGEGTHLLAPDGETADLSTQLELDSPLDDLERLLFVLSRLVGDVLALAVDRALAIRRLRATLALEPEGAHSVTINPALPTQSRELLLKLLNLELQAHPPPAAIRAVRLDADPAPPQANQRGLFQSQFPDPEKLDVLLARLGAIVGPENVGSPVLSNAHRDDAFTLAPFRPQPSKQGAAAVVTRLALRRFRPAQSARVYVINDRPHTLFWRGERLVIAEASGPWSRSGSWWDAAAFDLDFWDVATAEPPYTLRLQRAAASEDWQVVGLYE